MALVLNDRVKETTTTTGTGTINLGGAQTNFETFVAGIGDGNTTYYAIVHRSSAEFEIGLGTLTDASPDTLARTTIISSSNSDSAVNFSAGTKDVFCTMPASKAVHEDGSSDVTLPNDLILGSDSAILKIGADGDATLTHDGTTGLTIAATPISIDSTGELHLNSTTGDIKLQDGGTDQIAFDLDGTAGEVIMKPAVDSDDLVIAQYDGTEVIRIEDNASLGLVGNKLNIADSSSDVVIKPLTDAKDIIFQQYDGTTVATIEDNGTLNVPTGKLAINATAITSTAAELNILDGVTATATELNIMDGDTSATSTTLADADRVVTNDAGTMKQVALSDLKTYLTSAGFSTDDPTALAIALG